MPITETATSGVPAVKGITGTNANGIVGVATSATGWSAVYGEAQGGGAALHGVSNGGWGVYATGNYGVYGSGDTYGAFGISDTYGIYGVSSAQSASGCGVFGLGYDGVVGHPTGDLGWGIAGFQDSGYLAGYFNGDVYITGAVTATSANAGIKSFLIDHPLDPENRLLRHSCVESSARKTIYDGAAEADSSGEITVNLPSYVEALNEDIRYQLTAIGVPAPNLHVKRELSNGMFVISGAAAGQKVCWQLTGSRRDALARANPLLVEEDKPAEERGYYLHPLAHGQPEERGVDAARRRRRPPEPPRAPDPGNLPSPAMG